MPTRPLRRLALFGALALVAAGCAPRPDSAAGDADVATAETFVGRWNCVVETPGGSADESMRSASRVRFFRDGRREEEGTLAFDDPIGAVWVHIASEGTWRVDGARFISATTRSEVLGGAIDRQLTDIRARMPRLVNFIETVTGEPEVHVIEELSATRAATVHQATGVRTICTRR